MEPPRQNPAPPVFTVGSQGTMPPSAVFSTAPAGQWGPPGQWPGAPAVTAEPSPGEGRGRSRRRRRRSSGDASRSERRRRRSRSSTESDDDDDGDDLPCQRQQHREGPTRVYCAPPPTSLRMPALATKAARRLRNRRSFVAVEDAIGPHGTPVTTTAAYIGKVADILSYVTYRVSQKFVLTLFQQNIGDILQTTVTTHSFHTLPARSGFPGSMSRSRSA